MQSRTFNMLFTIALVLALLLSFLMQCNLEQLPFFNTVEPNENRLIASFRAISKVKVSSNDKILLGKNLFMDNRLSLDNTISCDSCHQLDNAGVDHLPTATGIGKQPGNFNTPTVFNSIFNFRQFWNGRSENPIDQINGAVNSHLEMDSNWEKIVAKLESDTIINESFRQLYDDGITAENIQDAIATFVASLITPNSRFDQYLNGNLKILKQEELSGLTLFQNYGCSACHQGINLGGNLYAKLGVVIPYYNEQNEQFNASLSRYGLTGDIQDKFKFKVPGLRNVALTAPYFHDGSITRLEDAVELMAYHQMGIILTEKETNQITAFLKTLSGEYKGLLL